MLRVNCTGVPECIKQARPHSGEAPVTHRVGNMLYIVWHDKRIVSLATTAHSPETFFKRIRSKHAPNNVREVQKPIAIQSFLQHMGGTDRADKAMTFYMVLHHSFKWWKQVFYLLEVSCNALVL